MKFNTTTTEPDFLILITVVIPMIILTWLITKLFIKYTEKKAFNEKTNR